MDFGAAGAAGPARAVGPLSARSERLGLDFKGLGWRHRTHQRAALARSWRAAEARGEAADRASRRQRILRCTVPLVIRGMQRPAGRGVWPAGARRRIASAAAMLETALGFFIALIVIISFAGLVFLYPLTFRVSVSTGVLAVHTAVPDDEEAAEEAEKEAKRESEVFEYVEAVQIRAVNAKDLRLRAEAMARIHSERSPPRSPPPPPPIHTTSSAGASRRACPPPAPPSSRPTVEHHRTNRAAKPVPRPVSPIAPPLPRAQAG